MKLLKKFLEPNIVDCLDVNGCMFSHNLRGKRSGWSQMRGLEMEIGCQIFLGTIEFVAQQEGLSSLIGWQPQMSKSPLSPP